MRITRNILLAAILFFSFSCKKNSIGVNANVGDVYWKILVLKATGDASETKTPTSGLGWRLTLKKDGNFVVTLINTGCDGTYTWSEVSGGAAITTNITAWRVPNEAPTLAEKLKSIMQAATKIEYTGGNPSAGFTCSGVNGYFRVEQ